MGLVGRIVVRKGRRKRGRRLRCRSGWMGDVVLLLLLLLLMVVLMMMLTMLRCAGLGVRGRGQGMMRLRMLRRRRRMGMVVVSRFVAVRDRRTGTGQRRPRRGFHRDERRSQLTGTGGTRRGRCGRRVRVCCRATERGVDGVVRRGGRRGEAHGERSTDIGGGRVVRVVHDNGASCCSARRGRLFLCSENRGLGTSRKRGASAPSARRHRVALGKERTAHCKC